LARVRSAFTTGGVAPGMVLLGRYKIQKPIGSGHGGQTWLAVTVPDGVRVALKIIPRAADPKLHAAQLREAFLLASVKHRAVVRYRGCVDLPEVGLTCLVTDYVPGGTLGAQWGGRVDAPEAWEVRRMLQELAAGLHALHEQGILHRDLKPANVLMGPRTDQRTQPILADLGVARSMRQGETLVTTTLGTLGYAAPEQHRAGVLGPKTDVYGLGALGWFLLTRQHPEPEAGTTQADPERLSALLPEALREEAADLVALIVAMLAHEPDQRPDLDTVRAVLDGGELPPIVSHKASSRRTWLPAGIATASLVAVLAVAVGLGSEVDAPAPATPPVTASMPSPAPAPPPVASTPAPAPMAAPEASQPEPEPPTPVSTTTPEVAPTPAAAPRPAAAPTAAAAVQEAAPPPPPTPTGTVEDVRVGLRGELPLEAALEVRAADGTHRSVRASQLRLQGVAAGPLTVTLVASGEQLGQDEVVLEAAQSVRVICTRTAGGTDLSCVPN